MRPPFLTYENLPPFPEDVPLAPLFRVSLSKLLENDEEENERLFTACRTLGFFYLELGDSDLGQALRNGAEDLLRLSLDAFTVPEEVKLNHTFAKMGGIFGYKSPGAKPKYKGGQPDTTEFWNVSRDDILGDSPELRYPSPLKEARPLLRSFATNSYMAGQLVMSILARQLKLPPSAFLDLHKLSSPSGDHIRLTHTPPSKQPELDIATASHTDFGSVTFLFNWVGGLQILAPEVRQGTEGQWNWVKPIPGHAICNMGDAMVKFTNGVFNSGRHRVIPPPGPQGKLDRYSTVYFVRPADDVPMKVLKSPGYIPEAEEEEKPFTAGKWIIEQARYLGAVKS